MLITHSFMCCQWLLSHYNGEWNSCNREHMARKVWNVYYLVPYRKRLCTAPHLGPFKGELRDTTFFLTTCFSLTLTCLADTEYLVTVEGNSPLLGTYCLAGTFPLFITCSLQQSWGGQAPTAAYITKAWRLRGLQKSTHTLMADQKRILDSNPILSENTFKPGSSAGQRDAKMTPVAQWGPTHLAAVLGLPMNRGIETLAWGT